MPLSDAAQSSSLEESPWQPIPLDRDNLDFIDARQKIETALAAIRGDNGYAETFPDERNQVVGALDAGVEVFRESASVHIEYIKVFIFEPLSAAVRRLKGNAAGTAATVARGAVIKWLAQSIGKNLRDWLRALF